VEREKTGLEINSTSQVTRLQLSHSYCSKINVANTCNAIYQQKCHQWLQFNGSNNKWQIKPTTLEPILIRSSCSCKQCTRQTKWRSRSRVDIVLSVIQHYQQTPEPFTSDLQSVHKM